MPNETLKMISRLKQSLEGTDFLTYLMSLSKKNYDDWKRSETDMNDIYKGKALAYDELIKLFEECDDKLIARNKETIGGVE